MNIFKYMTCCICTEELTPLDVCYLDGCIIHGFHEECINQWKNINKTCPICRKSFVNIMKLKKEGDKKSSNLKKGIMCTSSCLILNCCCFLFLIASLWTLALLLFQILGLNIESDRKAPKYSYI